MEELVEVVIGWLILAERHLLRRRVHGLAGSRWMANMPPVNGVVRTGVNSLYSLGEPKTGMPLPIAVGLTNR